MVPYRAASNAVRYNPFNDDLFRGFFPTLASAMRVDIQDQGDSYTLKADLPGYTKENIHIDLDEDVLTGVEGRNLEDVGDTCHFIALPGLVNVGENRQRERIFDLLQDSQPFFHADAPCGDVGAVSFVERGLEDKVYREVAADPFEFCSGLEYHLTILYCARSGNEEEAGMFTVENHLQIENSLFVKLTRSLRVENCKLKIFSYPSDLT
jgi:hypothetical protein